MTSKDVPPLRIVVGLGNPGPHYESTRHNLGFRVLDRIAERERLSFVSKFRGSYVRWSAPSGPVILVKPQTFMNLSGECVRPLLDFFKVELDTLPEALVVVHDDLDLGFGDVKVKPGGGHAGHNGLRSLIQHFGGSQAFGRVRLGIGRPARGDPADYVLAGFRPDEVPFVPDLVATGVQAVDTWVARGLQAAMNTVNGARKGSTP
jgi:PTH1 family peptidyl-tRNA hydrolase